MKRNGGIGLTVAAVVREKSGSRRLGVAFQGASVAALEHAGGTGRAGCWGTTTATKDHLGDDRK